MVDKGIIVSKISYIKQHLPRIKEAAEVSVDDFLKDYKRQDIALFNMQVVIQASIDIGNHIFSECDQGVPGSFSEIFYFLAEKKIITKELSEKLIKMVGFRNLVVHGYDKINFKRVFEIINTDLIDIDKYIQQITACYL